MAKNKKLAKTEKIGLFPLGLVLFPESAYPLHVFEERYKQLINTCLINKSVFGINLLTSTKMNQIGCSAEISDIMKKYPDGKMDILTVGIKRYRVIDFSDGETPYFSANIEYFDDDNDDLDHLLLIENLEVFNKIADNLTNVKIDKIKLGQLNTSKPSFYIAQKCGLSLEQKQILLESQSENFRLTFILGHLKKLLPIVKEAETSNTIIKNDGYFKPSFFNP